MNGNLIETFKIMKFLIMVGIFTIFMLELKICFQDRFQKLSLLTDCIFLQIEYYIFGIDSLISNYVEHFKTKLDDFRNKK